ncbi:Protein of unknown function (DUF3153) [Rivularia sp. PCC 7116]|uniref:DUF3153 domain-containing protein n=1 Tax=Rivularia sp. PCC 7116 TaxID=373994 RepID=UPI00029F3475|nr:DUF3153 domain-containing protein [Rivularia sp. PCC 7116]AFY53511.1 Protein of unknown function (DUF3153) [Rivularia sp. PCC 7116]
MSRLSYQKHSYATTTRLVKSLFKRIRLVCILLLASLLLSGCVDYDLGINVNNANYGKFVQHIKLGEKLTSFSGDAVYEWLDSIERRARELDGKAKRISEEEIIVSIPFSNGRELQRKYNTFFNSKNNPKSRSAKQAESESELPKIESNLFLKQSNFLLLVRNQLIYDLDLRSLGLISSKGNVLTNTGSILDLEFSLKTPWGASSIEKTEDSIEPQKNNKQLAWKLKPGQLNHIEAVFWLPSPVGIGTLFIVLFVVLGFYLRYSFMPDPKIQFSATSSEQ